MSGWRRLLALTAAMCVLGGCSGGAAPNGSTGTPGAAEQPPAQPPSSGGGWTEVVPGSIYTGEITVNTPEASGTVVYSENGVVIDASHTGDGYIMVKCEGVTDRVKALVQLGEEKYQYEINREGRYEVLPLQMGSGSYTVGVYQNVKENSYSPLCTAALEVDMPDENRTFVFPNQYVWYTKEERAVKLSYDLCQGLTGDAEKAERIYDYVVGFLSYDDGKAELVKNGTLTVYLSDLEEIMDTRKGICFDYSALYAAMLRAQNIPTRLAIGYVQPDNLYHAWNYVYINGKWVWKDPTFGPASAIGEQNYAQDREY